MSFEVISQNGHIPKEFLLNQKIIKVDFLKDTVVIYLDNGHDLYFHQDTGEVQLIKVDTSK